MSRPCRSLSRPGPRFPRVSGDEPGYGEDYVREVQFSPRERG